MTEVGLGLGVATLCLACLPRNMPSNPTHTWAGNAPAGALGRKAPPPAITPESDPDNVERRFGFGEARARREAVPPPQDRRHLHLVNAGAQQPAPGPTAAPLRPPDAGAPVRARSTRSFDQRDGGAPARR